MKKIGVRKTIPNKIVPKNTLPKINSTEKILVENFVALQNVMTNLSEKFNTLSTQISKLLLLFETSAKTIAEKGGEGNEDIIKKLDAILDQNKILAQGLTLLHEPKPMPSRTLPPTPPQKEIPQTQTPINIKEYQKSISTKNPEI